MFVSYTLTGLSAAPLRSGSQDGGVDDTLAAAALVLPLQSVWRQSEILLCVRRVRELRLPRYQRCGNEAAINIQYGHLEKDVISKPCAGMPDNLMMGE